MNVLVTGGLGYIGSAATKALLEQSHNVVIVDRKQESSIAFDVPTYQIDLVDGDALSEVFSKHKFDAVMHFAAYKAVGESMENPTKYDDNIIGTMRLLDCMVRHGVNKIVFSSSAAVYGMPPVEVVDESVVCEPINYYGYTKLACEQIIDWYAKIHRLHYVALRYFNVAGDCGLMFTEENPQNIIPIIMEVVTGKRSELTVFGNDYDTPDGTCVRDYIHVVDLVDAHIKALSVSENMIVNLGTGVGTSVKELIDCTQEVSGEINWRYGDRRAGDPAKLVATGEKAKSVLGWMPKKDVKDMLESAINVVK